MTEKGGNIQPANCDLLARAKRMIPNSTVGDTSNVKICFKE